MTTESMQRVQQGSSPLDQLVDNIPSQSIRSIQTIDGQWHDVSNCEFKFAGIGNSPAPGVYPSLKYKNEFGQSTYTSLKNVLSYSTDALTSQQKSGQGTR